MRHIIDIDKKSGICYNKRYADVVKLVDTQDLGSCDSRRGGSSPFIRTNFSKKQLKFYGTISRIDPQKNICYPVIVEGVWRRTVFSINLLFLG